ncbi:hypothetical protein SAMN06296065_11327 [Novosphingobium panipatense]|jgi:hypothetical protein|uniref:Uncharacterized protein n=1 Tax=Novosphingobium panipatense TaxID=428991 RepID=A0ABY1QW46_9SPHN|nr:hypothetical protein SAMN06296065_11327 [Novosphingobium panipatense]
MHEMPNFPAMSAKNAQTTILQPAPIDDDR